MESNYGLLHVWFTGDTVTRVTFAVLVLMSVTSWIVMLVKAIDLFAARRAARRVADLPRGADPTAALTERGTSGRDPFQSLARDARDAVDLQRGAASGVSGDWLTRALQVSIAGTTARLQSGLVVLASVGSTAPFVGLFGTVWGIYHALMRISGAGQVGISQVAGPIGEALIMTALGLAAAIPAVLGYNALVRGNKALLFKLGRYAHELGAWYATGARSPSGPRPELRAQR